MVKRRERVMRTVRSVVFLFFCVILVAILGKAAGSSDANPCAQYTTCNDCLRSTGEKTSLLRRPKLCKWEKDCPYISEPRQGCCTKTGDVSSGPDGGRKSGHIKALTPGPLRTMMTRPATKFFLYVVAQFFNVLDFLREYIKQNQLVTL